MGLAMGGVSIWWERRHQGTVGATYAMGLAERILVTTGPSGFTSANCCGRST